MSGRAEPRSTATQLRQGVSCLGWCGRRGQPNRSMRHSCASTIRWRRRRWARSRGRSVPTPAMRRWRSRRRRGGGGWCGGRAGPAPCRWPKSSLRRVRADSALLTTLYRQVGLLGFMNEVLDPIYERVPAPLPDLRELDHERDLAPLRRRGWPPAVAAILTHVGARQPVRPTHRPVPEPDMITKSIVIKTSFC
jgi:hypothetical protein